MADHPNTTRLGLTEARAQLSALVNDVHKTGRRVIIEKSGLPAAVLVSVADLENLLELQRAQFAEFLANAQAAFADVPAEEIEREALRTAREARVSLYEERQASAYRAADGIRAVREEP